MHFDFDRYTLRPEATRVLDEAVAAMKQDATLRLQIEGHTCNIGTAEYNLALGDRRANAVRDYLVSRGVAADRLTTVSYGEERPKYDNAREETRRLNRRAALVVNLHEVESMRFIHLYLVGYFVLVVGAVLALWQSGVLARVSAIWIAIGLVIAIGLGIMLAVTLGQA